jgi:hypothetical protein
LSEKLARQLPPQEWQQLFKGPAADEIRFIEKPQTILYADRPGSLLDARDRDSVAAEVEWLAMRHQGSVDHFSDNAAVVFFDDPAACVRMAMDLQLCASYLHLRMGLYTGLCEIAMFRCAGEQQLTLVGGEVPLAARLAATAATGSIALSPQTYALVQDDIETDAPGCLLMEEFHDSDLAGVSLTPAPVKGEHALSTFAGLGH